MSDARRPTYCFETLIVDPNGRIIDVVDHDGPRVTMTVRHWADLMRTRIRSMTVAEGLAAMLDRAARN